MYGKGAAPFHSRNIISYLEKCYKNFEQPEEEILAMRVVPLYAHIHFIYRICFNFFQKVLKYIYSALGLITLMLCMLLSCRL